MMNLLSINSLHEEFSDAILTYIDGQKFCPSCLVFKKKKKFLAYELRKVNPDQIIVEVIPKI